MGVVEAVLFPGADPDQLNEFEKDLFQMKAFSRVKSSFGGAKSPSCKAIDSPNS
jgi:hypothetical protein